jgi:threonine dehydrogenase-like Zn-dependent dehydrogenase
MGIVAGVDPEVTNLQPGDRVVIPLDISCGDCFICGEALYSRCES